MKETKDNEWYELLLVDAITGIHYVNLKMPDGFGSSPIKHFKRNNPGTFYAGRVNENETNCSIP